MRKLLSIFVLAAVAFAAQAVDVTVFDGTDQNEYIPFRATYFDWSPYYGEVIYPAAEITDLVGKDITSVKFYVANETGNVMNGGELSLYMGTTTKADFSEWSVTLIPADDLTLVSATAMTRGDSEIVFNLSEPFTYNGDNLVLMLSVTELGEYSGYGYFFGQNSSVKGSAYGAASVYAQQFYPKTTFTYDGEEPQVNIATTLAQANAMDDNAEFTFNGDAVVTLYKEGFQGVNYMFLRDESGFSMIAGVEDTFENGQVLSQGWNATKTSVNNGWVRYTDATGLSASGEINAELAAPIELSTVPDESLLNAYVVIKKTSVSNASGGFPGLPSRVYTLPDGNTIGKSETLWAMNGDASGGDFNVYGVIIKVGNALKINPVAFEPYEEPQPEWQLGDVNHDTFVNVADVTALIQYILTSGAQPEEFYVEQANVDGEGQINVADVTALIQIILAN